MAQVLEVVLFICWFKAQALGMKQGLGKLMRKLVTFGTVACKADANVFCVRLHLRSTGMIHQRDCKLNCEACQT
jgi:hypothetical protein